MKFNTDLEQPKHMLKAQEAIARAKAEGWRTLDLGDAGLKEVPEELFELDRLEALILGKRYDAKSWGKSRSGDSLKCLPAEIGQLTNLTSLDLPNNQLSELPAEIGQLTRLTSLDLRNNQFSEFPPEIGQLANLTALDLRNNQLSELPAEIGQLTRLTSLDLRNNQFSEFPPEIGQLANLTSLSLRGNKLGELPAKIGHLTSLSSLDLCGNELSKLPAELGQLTSLTSLNLRDNKLSELPAEIGQLTNLTSLFLRENQLSELSGEIGQLTSLTSLFLRDNKLSELPAEIGQLTNLTSLDLRNNWLSELPAEIGQLNDISSLYLSDNKLMLFQASILFLNKLNILTLYGNPVQNCPAEVLGEHSGTNCLEAIRTHFADQSHGSVDDRELKLFALGNGRVGKTSVLKRLIHDVFDPGEESTHGVRLESWQPIHDEKPVRVNVWDFGGQDIYHRTHSLFLKSRAIFLVVWDAASEMEPGYAEDEFTFEHFPLQYWLDFVRTFSPESPLIVIENKCDNGKGSTPPANFDGIPLVVFSAQEGHGRERLMAEVREAIGQELKHLGRLKIGVGRQNVKQAVRAYSDTPSDGDPNAHRTMNLKHFQELCAYEGDKVSSSEELLRFLHNTGVVYYQSGVFHDQIILDQRWVVDAIYTIFHRKSCYRQLRKLGGRFDRSTLHDLVWADSFTEAEQQLFLSFMESCSICFRVSDWKTEEPEYIAPSLLPDRVERQVEIDRWRRAASEQQGVHYRYHHQFLHQGVMQRFIVGVGMRFREAALYWRSGVAFESTGGQAVAVIDCERAFDGNPSSGEIRIEVRGSGRSQLLNQLRKDFELLSESRTAFRESVSMDGEQWVDVADLPKFERLGQVVTDNGTVLDFQPFRFLLNRDSKKRLIVPDRGRPEESMLPRLGESEAETKVRRVVPKLASADFETLVAAVPYATRHVPVDGTVARKALALIGWAVAHGGPGLAEIGRIAEDVLDNY